MSDQWGVSTTTSMSGQSYTTLLSTHQALIEAVWTLKTDRRVKRGSIKYRGEVATVHPDSTFSELVANGHIDKLVKIWWW